MYEDQWLATGDRSSAPALGHARSRRFTGRSRLDGLRDDVSGAIERARAQPLSLSLSLSLGLSLTLVLARVSVVKAGLGHTTARHASADDRVSTTSFGRVAIDGLHDVLGGGIVWLAPLAPRSSPTPTNMPAVFAIKGSQRSAEPRGCGMATTLCQPSCRGRVSPASCCAKAEWHRHVDPRDAHLISAPRHASVEQRGTERRGDRGDPRPCEMATPPLPEPRTRTR